MNRKQKISVAAGSALLLLLAVWAAFAVRGRFAGRMQDIQLPLARAAKVDRLELRFSDTCTLRLEKREDGRWQGVSEAGTFEADEARIQDFFLVLNTWEIMMIPADSQRAVWKNKLGEQGGKLLLKADGRKVFGCTFTETDGCFVIGMGKQVYAVEMPYSQMDFRHFFGSDMALWQNRLLFLFDYTGLASVRVNFPQPERSYRLLRTGDAFLLERAAGTDTVAASRAQAYLSSFGRVYFDYRDEKGTAGQWLYDMEVCPRAGACVAFSVFEKITYGHPDLFKALAVVPRGAVHDTVELPYVVLDKLVKRPGWFGGR
ncbi:MAG: hypothetical protein NC048_00270 [Bacteroides sp.]|nr:hypothetical protein [Ruminococcus flavefaciens]MCM1553918.1 hypothetical protein [Bacteroides sp.]